MDLTTIVGTLLAGLFGTGLMSVVMTVVHRTGWANADMIRALGALLTRRYENALLPGLAIHLFSGLLFAVPYAVILDAFHPPSVFMGIGLGALLGLAHGLVMVFFLLVVVAEVHPVARFRQAGFEVAAAHILGHVAYGIGVAAVVCILPVRWGFSV